MLEVRTSQRGETLITIQEVRHLAGIFPSALDVEVHRDDEKFWIVRFRMGQKEYILSTVRGAVRRWRQLDPVVDFLCAHHRDFRRVRIHSALRVLSPDPGPERTFVLEWEAAELKSAD
ncbi:hypothetical protein [Cupriavidus necator]|uniref:hypothetical protein n=1 Tax=Cupriavidus necator TaxID=106590 RepID=UPI00339D5A70